ncbi:hypothetical protein AB0M28_33750 [Streptomyces sp. NPDC051940]|uniref:hypothetical protein n=1 Tax=Streptomyces sp. NPDC051940 TaxID=3155675 RepID=UPI0034444339
MNAASTAPHWLTAAVPKAVPAIATTTVLTLARIWNGQGAEHSVGSAALMTALSLGAGAAGVCATNGEHGDSAMAAVAFTASGSLALAGVAAYTDGLALPLLLWAIATVLAYVVAARHWRQVKREQLDFDRTTTVRREEHAHTERVEAIRAGTQIETTRLQLEAVHASAAYAEALAQAVVARAALPGFRPEELTRRGLPQLPAAGMSKEN